MKKLVSNRKISAVLFTVSGFFFVSCSSVNLEENEVNNIMNGKPVKIDTVLKMDDNILDRSFTFAKFKDEIIAVGYIKDKSFYPKNLLNGFLSERN